MVTFCSLRYTLCAALVIAVAWCGPAAATAQTTALFIDSQPGDFVGSGQQLMLTPANATFQATFEMFGNGHHAISISVTDPLTPTSWSLYFGAADAARPQVGTYEYVTRWPFTQFASMSIYEIAHGCNTLTGRFVVREIAYAGNGATNSCIVRYDRVQNLMSLRDDACNWLPGATFASGAVQQNSQRSVAFGSSSASVNGPTLTLAVSLTFKPSYVGAKNIYLNVTSAAGTTTGWLLRGTWGVAPVMTLGPLTPASGSSHTELFTAVYGDSAGWQDLAAMYMKIGTSANGGTNTCMVRYDATAVWEERLSLRDDAGTWHRQEPYRTTIENSQCTLDLLATNVGFDTFGLTLHAAVRFKAPYIGAKNVYLNATSLASGGTGWQQVGTYTVTQPPPPGPVLTIGPISPNVGSSAAGVAQSFFTQFTDALGLADLAYVFVRFSDFADPSHDCVVRYDWKTFRFSLRDDAGNWQPATQYESRHNAQCTVSQGSVTRFTTNIGFELRVAFNASYAGDKTIYLRATRMDGTNTGWIPSGTRTVLASAISADSVTPNTGSGLPALFTSTFSHAAGVSSLSLMYVKIHTAPSGATNTCMIRYDRAPLRASLRADNGTWMPDTPVGSIGIVQQNSQCTVDFKNSSVFASGQSLSLTTRITFSPAFAGDKNIYLQATSVFGESTGWQQRGIWTVPTGP
jgi:hypothetical protein